MNKGIVHPATRLIFEGKSYLPKAFLALKNQNLWVKEIQDVVGFFIGDESVLHVKTSGATGESKNIELSKEVLIYSAKATLQAFELDEKSSAMLFLPAQFIGGKMMVLRTLVGGMTLQLEEPKSVLPDLRHKYDFVALTPMQAYHSITSLNNFGKVLLGGGAVSFELNTKLQKLECSAFLSYGMTETASHVAIKKLNGPDASDHFIALEGVSFDADERGCLIVNSARRKVNALRTNDLVELINSRQFIWKGRVDHLVNTGGVKVIPEEIERRLESKIISPFFIGSLPDEVLGEKLILFVEGKQKGEIDFKFLEKIKRPKQIFYLPKFIYTGTEKINRGETQKLALNL